MSTTIRVLPLVQVPCNPKRLMPGLGIPPEEQYNWLIKTGVRKKDSASFDRAMEIAREYRLPVKPVKMLKQEIDTKIFNNCLREIRDPKTDVNELPWIIALAKGLVEKDGMPQKELDEALKTLQPSVIEKLGIDS